jgi:hypothetical protein
VILVARDLNHAQRRAAAHVRALAEELAAEIKVAGADPRRQAGPTRANVLRQSH